MKEKFFNFIRGKLGLKRIIIVVVTIIVISASLSSWYVISYNGDVDDLIAFYKKEIAAVKLEKDKDLNFYENELKELDDLLNKLEKDKENFNYIFKGENKIFDDLKKSINSKISNVNDTIEKINQEQEELKAQELLQQQQVQQAEQVNEETVTASNSSKNTTTSSTTSSGGSSSSESSTSSSSSTNSSSNSGTVNLPSVYIKDGYYVNNGHKILITTEPARGSYTFSDPSGSSVWQYQSCTLYWRWREQYQDWGLSFQCGPSTEYECIEVAKRVFPAPTKNGSYDMETVSKKVWVYLNDGDILEGVPRY